MGRDAGTEPRVRRYRVVGGAAAWCLPLATTGLVVAALALGSPEIAAVAGALGWVGHGVSRGLVVESAPAGLTRGLVVRDRFLATAAVMPWRTVLEVRTDRARPGDDAALVTTVRDAEGRTVRFSTLMGLGDFLACLAEIARRAPAAARAGLTDALLAEGSLPTHHARPSAMAMAALSLILLALVGMHHVWAQGTSSLARYLEDIQTVAPTR
jgi:hypothetical protein